MHRLLSGEVMFVVTKKIVPDVVSFTHTHTNTHTHTHTHTHTRVVHVIGLVRTPLNPTANSFLLRLTDA